MAFSRLTLPLILIAFTAAAQQPGEKNYVRASAEASVSAQPDRARISVGVRTQAPTAKAAADQNANLTTQVLKTMKAILGAKGQVKTSNYSISPHWENVGPNSHQSGYECSNNVEVVVEDLSLLPQIIDASTANGANALGGIAFEMKDDSAVREQALAEASKKARAAAEAMAQALNLHVVGVASAESGVSTSPIRPMLQAAPMMARAIPTPVESGELDIRATATVTLEVSR